METSSGKDPAAALRVRPITALAAIGVAMLIGCNGDQSGWRVLTLDTDVDFQDMQFLDRDNGWIVGGSYQIEGGIVGRTRDGGTTWTFRSGLAGTGQDVRGLNLTAIEFLNENHGFIVGSRGVILKTEDGGENWRFVHRGPKISHLSEVHFIDDQTGWAVGSGGFLKPENGGEIWRSPVSDPGRKYLSGRDVHFFDRANGFLVGQHGRIKRTGDGGKTWTPVPALPEGEAPHLWDIFFLDARRGWIVGEHGTILATSDGGDTWSRQEGAADLLLAAVRFLDPENGWMVGYVPHHAESRILHTTDGGLTWTVDAEVTGEELRVLELVDSGHAWAIGDRARKEPQKLLRRFVPDSQGP
jgi:photosystem II stability/assembly factor-like uncharacterized protein